MSNNNNQPPDRVFGAETSQPQRETSSASFSSTGTASSANVPFPFGAASSGLPTSQAEPLRFGSQTAPSFGASNIPAFGQTPSTVSMSAPIASQPFQFGGAGNSPFQFNPANTSTSSTSSFSFGAPNSNSNSNTNFGFGSSASQFTFGASNTSSTTGPSAFGNTPVNTAQFGASTQNTQPTTAFGAAQKQQETIQIEDDSMSEYDDDTNDNTALVVANQRTSSEPPPNKPEFSFESTPPPKQEGSESSSSSTPLQKKLQRQQVSEFFSIHAKEQSSASPSSPLLFISPGSTEEINLKKPSSQLTFNKEDEGSRSRGDTLAHLEDPFDSSPIQKTVEPEAVKNDGSSAVVIEDLGNDKEKEPIAEQKEYQVEEPEEANVEPENNNTEKDDTVQVSTESVQQESNDESGEVEKKDEPSNTEDAPIEIGDSSDEGKKEQEQEEEEEEEPYSVPATREPDEEEKTDDQASNTNTQNDQEKPIQPSSVTKPFFSNVTAEKSNAEEPKKAAPLFSGFNNPSQSTLTASSSNKPPQIVFGNASTDTPNVEKPPVFTGFNFGVETAKLKSTIAPFGNVQLPPKDNTASERAGGAIKRKKSTKAGLPYDTGKSSAKHDDKPVDEIKAPAPLFPTFNLGTSASTGEKKAEKPVFPGYNFGAPSTGEKKTQAPIFPAFSSNVSSKSPIVEEGPKETNMPTFKPIEPVKANEPPPKKNPFAGISFSASGSTNTTQAASSETTKMPAFGSVKPVGESKGFGAPVSGASPFGSIKPVGESGGFGAPTSGASPFGSIKPVGEPKGFGAPTSGPSPFGSASGATSTFGASDKPPSTTPFAGFGATSGNKETPSFGGTDKSSKTSGFTFPTTSSATSTPSFGFSGDKTSASKPEDTSKASPFKLGDPAPSDSSKEPSKKPLFSFGNTSSDPKEPAKVPAPSFGSASDKDKAPVDPPTFSFGGSSSDPKAPVNPPAFSFRSTSDKDKEPSKTPSFSFGSAGDKAKEAVQASGAFSYSLEKSSPFATSTTKANSTPSFSFGSNLPSNETSKNIFKFGASETSTASLGSSSMSQERSNKKKRHLDSDEEDGPPANKKTHFNIQMPSAPSSSSSSSNTKKRQLDNDDDEETSSSNKKTSTGFTFTTPADNKLTFGKPKEDTSKETQDKENKSPSFAFGAGPGGAVEETPVTSEKTTTPADILPKSATTAAAVATPAPGTSVKKPSPLSKEITFAANSKSTATKKTGSVAIAFSKKDVVENETLNVKPVKLISSELSAEIGTLKSDMISFSDEVLQTRFWQLSPEVQQNMTAFDAFVNAHIENFKRFEKSRRPAMKDTLTATTQKIKALSMDTDNLSQLHKHVTNDVEVFKERVALQKCNITAAKEYKTQQNIYLQERDEKINWKYMKHMADEMESRLEEYQKVIPSMEESISNMRADATPSVSDINSALDHQSKVLVELAGRTARTHDDVHAIRLTRTPPK